MELKLIEYSNIIYVGDLHGEFNEFVQSTKDCTNSLYILTGDLGLGCKKRDIEIDDFSKAEYILASNNNCVIIIRGNNDNPAYFKKKSGYRNDVLYDSPHIILVPDYSIIYTKNHTILCIGGAYSINRWNKNNWYKNEQVTKPIASFYENIEKNNIHIDIVVSHTAPLFCPPIEFSTKPKKQASISLLNSMSIFDKNIKNDIYKERLLLKGIYEKLNNKYKIQKWVYGHFHASNTIQYNKTKFISLNLREQYKNETNN